MRLSCEITGSDPLSDSIWQFTCLPLDFRLDTHKTKGVFDLTLQPHSDACDPKFIGRIDFSNSIVNGLPQEVGSNLFHEWFERLNLSFKKRIVPLTHNWPLYRQFVDAWFRP